MLIGDNCLFAMSFQHVGLLVLQKFLIWSRRVFAEGASSCRGQGAVVQKGLVQMEAWSRRAEGPRPVEGME